MYVGRIVAIGMTSGRSWAGYRVSSRSFPNRHAKIKGRDIAIAPIDPMDLARNPYIAYSCIRTLSDVAVVANGTQADTVIEKISDGMRPLDAIGLTLLAYGYERDELDTPRLAGAIRGHEGWLGTVQKGQILVKEFQLKEDDAFMVATYEKTGPDRIELAGKDAESVARGMFDLSFERPVCSAAAFQSEAGYELAVHNPV